MLDLFFYMNPVLIAAAVIPAILLLIYVYKADKLEKESPGILFSLVVYGVLSTFLAQLAERVGDWILTALQPSVVLYNILLFFGVVAFAEEGFKYLVLKLRTWKSRSLTASLTASYMRCLSLWDLLFGKTLAMCCPMGLEQRLSVRSRRFRGTPVRRIYGRHVWPGQTVCSGRGGAKVKDVQKACCDPAGAAARHL